MGRRGSDNEVKGAQVGDRNTQHNTYLPPAGQAESRASGRGQASSITAGDHSTVNNTQKQTNLKFSIPVIGPLLSAAVVHPVAAAVTTVVVLGGAGVAGQAALSDSGSSSSSSTTTIQRGIQLKRSTSADSGTPIGYDFSQIPPTVAGPKVEAIYNEGTSLMSTSVKIAPWTGSTVPSGPECLTAVRDHTARSVGAYPESLICYVDRNGNPGYILVTAYDAQFLTVDIARLK